MSQLIWTPSWSLLPVPYSAWALLGQRLPNPAAQVAKAMKQVCLLGGPVVWQQEGINKAVAIPRMATAGGEESSSCNLPQQQSEAAGLVAIIAVTAATTCMDRMQQGQSPQ